jgi:hypothetical protein
VQKGEAFLRVLDVAGSSFMVRGGDSPEYVAMQMRSANVKVEKRLKLTAAAVRIENFRSERIYTPENDPRQQFTRESGAATGAHAAADVASYQRFDLYNQLTGGGGKPTEASEYVGDGTERGRAMEQLARQEVLARAQLGSDMTNSGYAANKMLNALDRELFDAMEVEFEVSSEQPLTDTYLIVISRFQEPGAKAGMVRNWIFAQSLGEVGPKPRLVRIREGGFPVGFKLLDSEVHLYQGGRELASNVSPKRVELTRAEAQQYLMIDHLAAHKDTTVPAEPAVGRLPSDLRERLSAGHYLQPYYVRVDEDGDATGVFLDAACRKPVTDPYLTDLFAAVLFKPALVAGKPTVAVCRVKLPELRL